MALLNLNRILHNPRFSQQVSLMRRSISTDAEGDQVNEYLPPKSITAVLHPAGADDLQLLPEGERYLPSQRIFSHEKLTVGDIFIFHDKKWRISVLSNWGEYGFYDGVGVLHEGTQEPLATGFKLK